MRYVILIITCSSLSCLWCRWLVFNAGISPLKIMLVMHPPSEWKKTSKHMHVIMWEKSIWKMQWLNKVEMFTPSPPPASHFHSLFYTCSSCSMAPHPPPLILPFTNGTFPHLPHLIFFKQTLMDLLKMRRGTLNGLELELGQSLFVCLY